MSAKNNLLQKLKILFFRFHLQNIVFALEGIGFNNAFFCILRNKKKVKYIQGVTLRVP